MAFLLHCIESWNKLCKIIPLLMWRNVRIFQRNASWSEILYLKKTSAVTHENHCDDQSLTRKKFAFALTWAKRAKTIGLMPEKHMEFINPTKTIKFGVTVLCIVDWKTSRVMKSSRVWVTNNDGVLQGVAVGRLKMVETCPSLELPRLFLFLVELTINRENNTR